MSFFVSIYKLFVSKSNDCMFVFKPFQIKEVKPNKYGPVPKARSGHRIVTDDEGNIYSFGGYNPDLDDDPDMRNDEDWLVTKPLFRELWKFNVSNKKWIKLKTKGQAPGQLVSHCLALVGNKYLIVYGGTGVPFGQNSSNKIHICNLENLQWQLVEATGDIPMEQYGQSFVYDQQSNSIYVVGGTNGFLYSIDVHKFDFETMIWTELYKKLPHEYELWPVERYRHEIALYENKLYIIGGGTAQCCFDIKSIPVFDIKTCTWSIAETVADNESGFPEQRKCHGLVQLGHNIYIAGGTNGNIICDDIWNLNILTLQWRKISQRIPRPVFFHSAAVSPYGQMSIFGGVTDLQNNRHNRSSELYSIWLTVPALKELAWLAVSHYIDHNKLYKTCMENAQIIGIPYNYQARLQCKIENTLSSSKFYK